jgi:hypothetical protein
MSKTPPNTAAFLKRDLSASVRLGSNPRRTFCRSLTDFGCRISVGGFQNGNVRADRDNSGSDTARPRGRDSISRRPGASGARHIASAAAARPRSLPPSRPLHRPERRPHQKHQYAEGGGDIRANNIFRMDSSYGAPTANEPGPYSVPPPLAQKKLSPPAVARKTRRAAAAVRRQAKRHGRCDRSNRYRSRDAAGWSNRRG